MKELISEANWPLSVLWGRFLITNLINYDFLWYRAIQIFLLLLVSVVLIGICYKMCSLLIHYQTYWHIIIQQILYPFNICRSVVVFSFSYLILVVCQFYHFIYLLKMSKNQLWVSLNFFVAGMLSPLFLLLPLLFPTFYSRLNFLFFSQFPKTGT